MTTEYGIQGMTCGGCVRGVTNALLRAQPDLKLTVDLERAVARIEGAHDPAEIQQAVERAGFVFGGRIEASPDAG